MALSTRLTSLVSSHFIGHGITVIVGIGLASMRRAGSMLGHKGFTIVHTRVRIKWDLIE